MVKQLAFALRPGQQLRFDAGQPVNWRALDRQARRIAASITQQCSAGAREGFAIRRHAEDLSLLATLRKIRRGKHLRQKARSMHVPAATLFLTTQAGQRVERLIERLERRAMAREDSTLCG